VDTIDIFWLGSSVIAILFFVIFLDKKCHSELMIWIQIENKENKIIITNTQEQKLRVDTKHNSTMKANEVKS